VVKKVLKINFGSRTLEIKKISKNSKNDLFTCQFFYWFLTKKRKLFDVYEVTKNNNSLILIIFQKTKSNGSLILKFFKGLKMSII
jgi:hypothetical protein